MPDGIYDKAVIAQGLHLLPFRTEKLNLVTSMVLLTRESRKLSFDINPDFVATGTIAIPCSPRGGFVLVL